MKTRKPLPMFEDANLDEASKDDTRSAVLSVIMKRYGGLTNLIDDLRNDPDVVYTNLDDDLEQNGVSLSLGELEDEIRDIVK